MKEQALLLGDTNALVGVLTSPDSSQYPDNRTAVILLNAGVIHRVGPHRLYVKLARTLAAFGFPVLRFDLSGIGDSSAATSTLDYQSRVIDETKQAMNYLTSKERAEKFILIGLCSGANNSIRVACADERVVGAVLIDSYFYVSTGFSLEGYCNRIFNPRSWQRFIFGQSDVWRIINRLLGRQIDRSNPTKQTKSTDTMIAELTALRAKNIPLFLVYTRNNSFYHQHHRIIKKTLASQLYRGTVQIKYFAQSDHTFTLLSYQQLLLDAIRDWLQRVTNPLPKDACIRFTEEAQTPGLRSSHAYSNEPR
jgi:pimeloyl-ACP methyl ester carboxylesterase